ncbi:orotate phosphoribosyltransferase [Gemmatimonas sp.]
MTDITDTTETYTARLIALLAERSAKRGDFVLASGRRSSLYVDCRLTAMHPEGQLLIGRVGLATLRASGWTVDSVGGLTLGADPIAYAIAHASALAAEQGRGEMVRGFTVRKEAKQHGTGKLIEGPFQPGDHVVVVEDVITTGGSALKAVDAVRAAGGTVVGVLALVDRQEGGREAIEATGLQVLSLVTAEQLLPLIT